LSFEYSCWYYTKGSPWSHGVPRGDAIPISYWVAMGWWKHHLIFGCTFGRNNMCIVCFGKCIWSEPLILKFAIILGFNCYLVKVLMSYFLVVLLIALALLFLKNNQLTYFVTFLCIFYGFKDVHLSLSATTLDLMCQLCPGFLLFKRHGYLANYHSR
jgi:hypothetical protein